MNSKVQKFLTRRKSSGVAQTRKQQHEAEINFMQQKFRSKLSKLQKYLITRKQFLSIDIYGSPEDHGQHGILKPITNTKYRHQGKFDGLMLSKDEHDEKVDKIMAKILPKYDIKKMIQKETDEEQHLQRRKIIENMLEVMENDLKAKEEGLIHEFEFEDSKVEQEQNQLQYDYMEERSHFRTLQLMLDKDDYVVGQILTDENEFSNKNQEKNNNYSKFRKPNQKIKVQTRLDTSPIKLEKLEEINAKARSKLLVTSHLHRLGVLTQRDSLMKCDSLRDTRGRLKVPQTESTFMTTHYFAKSGSSQLSTKPSGFATARTQLKNTSSQATLDSFPNNRLTTQQSSIPPIQIGKTKQLQQLFSQCLSMQQTLKIDKKKMRLKVKGSLRNFTTLESKLYEIKNNNFLRDELMINI